MTQSDFVIKDKTLVRYNGKERTVIVPDGVKIIGGSAFRSNKKIRRVVLPQSVREIGAQAFAFCGSLRHINLPDSLTIIHNDAFWYCYGVQPDHFPDHPPVIGNVFSLGHICPALRDAYRVASMKYTDMYKACIVTVTNLRKHKNADRLQCTEIFGNNIIVDNTCRIGQKLVYFPLGGVLDETFAKENNLLRKWDENGKPIGGYINPRKRNVMPLELRGEISEGLALPIEVLSKYTDIKKLKKGDRFCELNGYSICGPYVPKGMTIDFEKKRLYSMKNKLDRIVIPWGVETINGYAFCLRKEMETLYIPDSVTTIEHHAFEGCENLRCVKMPDSVRVIENYAFNGCKNLRNVRIPKHAKDIGRLLDDPVFDGSTVDTDNPNYSILDGVVFSKDITELIRYPLLKEDERYTVPAGVKRIKDSAFFGNKFLREIIICDGVTHIEHRAFENCKNLRIITIPPSVTYMGNFVFIGINNVPNRKQEHIKGDIGKASIKSILSALNSIGASEGILIRGKAGSVAERYAQQNGCWFEVIK